MKSQRAGSSAALTQMPRARPSAATSPLTAGSSVATSASQRPATSPRLYAAREMLDPASGRPAREARRQGGAHHRDVRAGGQQALDLPLGHRTAADDEHGRSVRSRETG